MEDPRFRDLGKETLGNGSEQEVTEYLGPTTPSSRQSSSPAVSEVETSSATARRIIGSKVGSIRIERRLAIGGVGELYVGIDEVLERKVVLKALRGDRRSPRWRSRLLREARILSRLQDPKICQIYDYLEGDETDYLVLELIEGRTLKEATKERLAPSLRMRIAEQIAEVLAKAHANGVIHRDLKPSNVMLTKDESVKVLDFGISSSVQRTSFPNGEPEESLAPLSSRSSDKAPEMDSEDDVATLPWVVGGSVFPESIILEELGEVSPGRSNRTRTGSVLGTLSYMSPEQARGEVVSPASDIYSFGLLLQELFSGARAYDEGASQEELAQQVLAGESRPLTDIEGDLATLIQGMKSRAPEDRPTASAVAQRLRWIHGKSRRRFRALAAVTAAAGLILALIFHVRGLQKERNLAMLSEQRAVAARLEAEQVVEFLEEMFEVSIPDRAKGETITAREVLDRGAARIDEELEAQPQVQARLKATMGSVYFRLGLFGRSEKLLREALETRRRELPGDAPEVADSSRRLGLLLNELSQHQVALDLYEEAQGIFEGHFGPESREVIDMLQLRVVAHGALSQYEKAEALGRRLLAVIEESPDQDSQAAIQGQRSLANIYRKQGLYEKALPYYEQARRTYQAAEANSLEEGMNLYNLGIAYTQLGRYPEAEEIYLHCREIWRNILGSEHSDVAKVEMALATLFRRMERFEAAEEGFLRAMVIWHKTVGPDNPYMGLASNNLGSVYLQQKRYEEAEARYRRALAVFEESYGASHPNISMTLSNLGELAWLRGHYDEAEDYLLRALALDEEISGPEHPDVGWDLHLLGNLARDRSHDDEAEALYRRSFAILGPILGEDHPDVIAARKDYSLLLENKGARH